MYQCTEEFKKAAKPLMEYLLKFSVNDPIHDYVLADLYDMINMERDRIIKFARESIADAMIKYEGCPELTRYVAQLGNTIRFNEGD